MNIQKNCIIALTFLATLPASSTALLYGATANSDTNSCEATVSSGNTEFNYACNHYTTFNSSRWCRADSEYDPCPKPLELEKDCNENTYVTTGNATLSYLFPDAAITISENCEKNTLLR